jgi:hypothetical protein
MATASSNPSKLIRTGPKTYAIFMRFWRRDAIATLPTHRALKALYNAGFRGRDLDLTYDTTGPVRVPPMVN